MQTIARSGEPVLGVPAPCHRIPALAVVGERLLLAHDVRTSPLDLPGPNGIALRHSDDRGRTWSAPRWLHRPDGGWGFADASLVTLADGTVLAWAVASSGGSFWDDQRPGEGWRVWLSRSTDGGATWAHTDQSRSVWPAGAGCVFASSGNGVQLAGSRLLQPLVTRRAGTQLRDCRMAISDDGGATWTLGAPVEGGDETKVAETPDGRVWLHARSTPRRLVADSDDGGETFSAPRPDVPDPGCNGGLAALPDGRLACTLVHPAGAAAPAAEVLPDPTGGRGTSSGPRWADRRNLVLRTGTPGDWGPPTVLDPSLAAYSVAQPLPGGGLAVAWEFGHYDGIRFAVVDPSEP